MERTPRLTVAELRAMAGAAPKLSRAGRERRERLRDQFAEERRIL